jgi:phage shock protein C
MSRDTVPQSYSEQPPSRTKFYRDKRHGKFLGVCSGIADYTGFDVTLVRILLVASIIMGSGAPLLLYLITAFMTQDRPRELDFTDREEQRFWQGVRASPRRTARDIRSRMREIDRRLADIESYVTTENRTLAREIDQLR